MRVLSVLLRWILGIVITTSVIIFSIANRQSVVVTWSPFNLPAALPIFLPALAGLAIGFLSGGLMVWLGGAEIRADRRRQSRALRDLERKVEQTGENAEDILP